MTRKLASVCARSVDCFLPFHLIQLRTVALRPELIYNRPSKSTQATVCCVRAAWNAVRVKNKTQVSILVEFHVSVTSLGVFDWSEKIEESQLINPPLENTN